MGRSIKIKERSRPGFTIVELLIVIVVIAILATISIVAYRGIQDRAQDSRALAAANSVVKLLGLSHVNDGIYPNDLSTINNGGPMSTSDGTTYAYRVGSGNTSYCATVTNGNSSYKVSDTNTVPTSGGCPGDGVGGVAAITNLSLNPKGVGTSGWFSRLDATSTDTANVSWGGKDDWHRFVRGSTHGVFRMNVQLSDLENGQTYASSILVANPGTASFSGTIDFCDQGNVGFTLAPGETRRISLAASRATYDSTYRFFDISLTSTAAEGLLVSEAMVTAGPIVYSYADGNTPNWIWNGAQNNSTSTGPPL